MAWWEEDTGLLFLLRSSVAAITYWAASGTAVAELNTVWGYLETVAAAVATFFGVLLQCSSSAAAASIATSSSASASAAAALILTRGQVEVLQELVPLLPVWGNSAVIGHVPLLCASGAEVQWDVSEVDPAWPSGWFPLPGGVRRAGVSSSLCSAAAASTSSSSSAPSAVAERFDAVACAVTGCCRRL